MTVTFRSTICLMGPTHVLGAADPTCVLPLGTRSWTWGSWSRLDAFQDPYSADRRCSARSVTAPVLCAVVLRHARGLQIDVAVGHQLVWMTTASNECVKQQLQPQQLEVYVIVVCERRAH